MPSTDPDLKVVAGVIRNTLGEVLLAQRQPGRHQAGKWEFPGGKREPNESPQRALARELQEELGVVVDEIKPRIRIPHQYPDLSVELDVYDVLGYSGEPRGVEGQAIAWVGIEELRRYEYPEANLAVISSLELPDCYTISNLVALGEQQFRSLLIQALKDGMKLFQFREPDLALSRYRQLAADLTSIVHAYGAKILLNTEDVDTVKQVDADGIHLSSKMLMSLEQRPLEESKLVAASCHNSTELDKAMEIGADFAVLSPVNKTASHPQATPMGWQRFSDLTARCSIPVYALGGMRSEDSDEARERGGQGVALLGAAWGE